MILCQDAYGPGTKIDSGLRDGVIEGAILSPRWRREPSLPDTVGGILKLRSDAFVLFDPSLYLAEMRAGLFKKAESYDYFTPGLNRGRLRRTGASKIAQGAFDAQRTSEVSMLVSPGIRIDSPDDWRSEFNLQLFERFLEAAASDTNSRPALLSLVLSEAALNDTKRLGELLDALTTLDAAGFYLVVLRENDSDPLWGDTSRAARHENLLYLVHVLRLNDYLVHVGFTDINGLLLTAAGANSVGTSWFKSARQICCVGMGESTGGRPARGVSASGPLLSWVLLSPDLQSIQAVGRLSDVLNPDGKGGFANPLQGQWNRDREVSEYWSMMRHLSANVSAGDPETRVNAAVGLVDSASALVSSLEQSGASFERRPRHLGAWAESLQGLKGRIQKA